MNSETPKGTEEENKRLESENVEMQDYKKSNRYMALRALIRHVAYICAENDYKELYESEFQKYNASKTEGVKL